MESQEAKSTKKACPSSAHATPVSPSRLTASLTPSDTWTQTSPSSGCLSPLGMEHSAQLTLCRCG
jgi:hypothetical protein